jgi:hypothetical protein
MLTLTAFLFSQFTVIINAAKLAAKFKQLLNAFFWPSAQFSIEWLLILKIIVFKSDFNHFLVIIGLDLIFKNHF